MKSKFALAIETHGLSVVAKRLGESLQTISNWIARGVPVHRCAAVEIAVDGAVMRWDLRPDDWHLIWPELIGTKGAPSVPAKAEA